MIGAIVEVPAVFVVEVLEDVAGTTVFYLSAAMAKPDAERERDRINSKNDGRFASLRRTPFAKIGNCL